MYNGKMYVKPYSSEYRKALQDIHMATASDRARNDQRHGTFSLLMYCDEYLDHETAFMLMDEQDIPRGYVLCAKDALKWKENMASYGERIRSLGEPYISMLEDNFQTYTLAYEEYPAHLHIDILEEYTGNHHGTMLMNALIEALKAEHVRGICLGVARANQRAAGFYRHIGFEVLEESEGGYFLGMKL